MVQIVHKVFQKSPYIFKIKEQNYIYNYLNQKKYPIEGEMIEILNTTKAQKTIGELYSIFNNELVLKMIEEKLLLDASEDIWSYLDLRIVEIEIGTICNWNCRYCPVSSIPKINKNKTMGMELFNEILQKSSRYPSVEYITINSYNEPTVDLYFEERIRSIAETRLKLLLFTNGSFLDKKKINLLKEYNILESVTFNLPAINKENFKYLTGYHDNEKVLCNIEDSIEAGLKVNLSIQGTEGDLSKNLTDIQKKFSHILDKPIKGFGTRDRAGIIKNEFCIGYVTDQQYLRGCRTALEQLQVNVEGECYLCCEDYSNKYTFGNIRDGEIKDILRSKNAQQLRKYIFGGDEAPDDFICRRCSYTKEDNMNYDLI